MGRISGFSSNQYSTVPDWPRVSCPHIDNVFFFFCFENFCVRCCLSLEKCLKLPFSFTEKMWTVGCTFSVTMQLIVILLFVQRNAKIFSQLSTVSQWNWWAQKMKWLWISANHIFEISLCIHIKYTLFGEKCEQRKTMRCKNYYIWKLFNLKYWLKFSLRYEQFCTLRVLRYELFFSIRNTLRSNWEILR